MEEEITPTEVVEETETIDSTNDEEQETEESEVVTLEDYHKEKAAKDKLYQRAKKAEQELKALKAQGSKPLINNNSSGLTRDEAILIAKGVPEEVINEANDIAKAKGITLSEAMKTPIVTAFIANLKQVETKEKAQLGSSGSGGKSSKVELSQAVGMTEEEHRKAIGM